MPCIELNSGLEYVLAPDVWRNAGLLETMLEMDLTPASRTWVLAEFVNKYNL
ncbi:MAG: hypothetical protein JRH15_23185 [Deltaproteobacteria bacterium]|nr:hypothetical protein [Deltaproteobacteria bacterium]